MAWEGYFQYDGNEFINVTRTETYMKNAGFPWFRPLFKNDALPFMVGDGLRYSSPMLDDAPWVDPDIPDSLGFYGLYPLDITGLEDSTRTSTPVESLTDGGIAGRIRNTTRQVVFSGVLLAASEASAEYGMRWLKQALLGGACGTPVSAGCNGADLCYLSSEPDMEFPEIDEQLIQALLDGGFFAQDVTSPGGGQSVDGGTPSEQNDQDIDGGTPGGAPGDELGGGFPGGTGDGGTYLTVPIEVDQPDLDGGSPTALPNYTFEGGTPYLTGGLIAAGEYPFNFDPSPGASVDPEECLSPYLRHLRRVVFNSGPTVTSKRITSDDAAVWTVQFTGVAGSPFEIGSEVPVIAGFLDPQISVPWAGGETPEDGSFDLVGSIYTEESPVVIEYAPIFDPLYPALIPPPGPPSVPLGNFSPPLNWRRRQFTIPKQYVPLWGEVVPKVQVHARTADLRNLRLRFYADPFKVGDISDDPNAYCGDIVVSYVPQDHSLIIDGSDQTVYILTPGGVRRRADSLVFKTDGTPFEWPSLSCGFGYVVTLDLPQTQAPPVVDLSLFSRAV